MASHGKTLILTIYSLLLVVTIPTDVTAVQHDFPVLEGPRDYLAQEIEAILNENHGVVLRNLKVKGPLRVAYGQKVDSLHSENVIFEHGIDISGSKGIFLFMNTKFLKQVDFFSAELKKLNFENCHFKHNANFHSLESPKFSLRKSTFDGHAVFVNTKVGLLNLTDVYFEKSVDFSGALIGWLHATRIRTNEPIQISWSQFGKKWLRQSLLWALAGGLLGDEEKKSRLKQKEAALLFWKRNFLKLGYQRDVLAVNYEIIELRRKYFMNPSQLEWWVSLLLRIPNRYGTRSYRPLWFGLIIIFVFAIIYWLGNPFSYQEEGNPKIPEEPLLIFSLLYSIDTFIPLIDVTGVKSWGWGIISGYRWIELAERILGLAVTGLAAYSIGYYVL